MSEFLMPKLGADMTAGTLVAWRKQPGDTVNRGDIVAEVDTEKGVIDVEIFTSGVLEKLLVPVGQKVPVGTPLATVRDDAMLPAAANGQTRAAADSSAAAAPSLPMGPVVRVPATPSKWRGAAARTSSAAIGPSARRRARQLGLDPSKIIAASCGGGIMILDANSTQSPSVQNCEEFERESAPATAAAEGSMAQMRNAIAAAMSRSKREIPHYYVSTTVDMTAVEQWLAEHNAARAVIDRVLYGALLLKAIALTLRKFPELNALWEDGSVVKKSEVHLGVAISLRQGGLIAPAIHRADQLSVDDLMAQFRDLVTRARTGALRSSELSDQTSTVTSLGEQGVESVLGIIYPPQVSLFGVGKVVMRPWVVDEQVLPRSVTTVTLSADHRVTDGHFGARALNEIDRLLQEPGKL